MESVAFLRRDMCNLYTENVQIQYLAMVRQGLLLAKGQAGSLAGTVEKTSWDY